jgi:lysophospholipase L1-like esterase
MSVKTYSSAFFLFILIFFIFTCTKDQSTDTKIAKPPTIKMIPTDSVFSVNDTAMFSVSSFDSDGVVKAYLWSFDGSRFDTTKDSMNKHIWLPDSSGEKILYAKSLDDDGLFSETIIFHFRIKLGIPTIKMVTTDSIFSVNDTAMFSVSSFDSDGVIKAYLWSFDGSHFDTTTDSTFKRLWLPDSSGNKILSVKSLDDDGLFSETILSHFRIKLGIPTIKIVTTDSVFSIADTATFSVSSYDSDGVVKAYLWSFDGSHFDTTKDSMYKFIWPRDSSDKKDLYVKSLDDNGLLSETVVFPFRIKPAVPLIKLIVDTTKVIDDSIALHTSRSVLTTIFEDTIYLKGISLSDYKIARYEWKIGDSKFQESSRNDTSIILPAKTDPAFICVLQAVDKSGNTTKDSVFIRIEPKIKISAGPNPTNFWRNAQKGIKQKLVLLGTSYSTTYYSFWPQMLQDRFNDIFGKGIVTVDESLAKPGISSSEALSLFSSKIAQTEPNAVILEYTTNDSWDIFGVSVSEHKQNLLRFIEIAKNCNPNVEAILYGSGYPFEQSVVAARPNWEAYRTVEQEICNELKGVFLFQTFDIFKNIYDSLAARGMVDEYRNWVRDWGHSSIKAAEEIIVPGLISLLSSTSPIAQNTSPAISMSNLRGRSFFIGDSLTVYWNCPMSNCNNLALALRSQSISKSQILFSAINKDQPILWPIPDSIGNRPTIGKTELLILNSDSSILSASDTFDILPNSLLPCIRISDTNNKQNIGDTITMQIFMDKTKVTGYYIKLSLDSGRTYKTISSQSSNSPNFTWIIPDSIGGRSTASTGAIIKIQEYDGKCQDMTMQFTIEKN